MPIKSTKKMDIKKSIKVILIDFDGVLTDNFVYVSEEGLESVRCSRSDGLAINILKKYGYKLYIFSTETNFVVLSRAKKLRIDVIQGINNKKEFLIDWARKKNFDLNSILYIGNDINDYGAMQLCGIKVCPLDSHESIKKISDFIIDKKGGEGVITGLLEILDIDYLDFFK